MNAEHLIDYIKSRYKNQEKFALAEGVHKTAVSRWKKNRVVVIDGELYAPLRELKSHG